MILWQDIVFTVCSISFSYALIPQVLKHHKEKKVGIAWQTVIVTPISLWVYNITAYTLGLYFSAIVGVVSSACWTTFLIQKLYYGNQEI